MKSKLIVLFAAFMAQVALADVVTLTNGPNGGGSTGVPNGTITMSDGSSIYFRVGPINTNTSVVSYVNFWGHGTAANIGPGTWIQTGDHQYRLTVSHAAAHDPATGAFMFYVDLVEDMSQYFAGGSGRGGGYAGWHWKVLGGSWTFSN